MVSGAQNTNEANIEKLSVECDKKTCRQRCPKEREKQEQGRAVPALFL
jgi:hypothetical protein